MNYEEYKNIDKIREKIRRCKFCGKKKITKYKITEASGTHAICDGCLRFITGMHDFAQTT